jgi:hypothetical protein
MATAHWGMGPEEFSRRAACGREAPHLGPRQAAGLIGTPSSRHRHGLCAPYILGEDLRRSAGCSYRGPFFDGCFFFTTVWAHMGLRPAAAVQNFAQQLLYVKRLFAKFRELEYPLP